MNYPKKINRGDTIGLICPCSAVDRERENKCVEIIESMGYKVKKADNISENYAGYMAGSGRERGNWINRMFADDDVDAIFCVRGGNGGNRAMEYIDQEIVRNNPKIFVGYSDVTSMHLLFNQNCDLVTFHGPMVSSNMVDKFDDETRDSLMSALTVTGDYDFSNPAMREIKVLQEGKAEGRMVGGNLTLLSASLGTWYEVDTKDSILFIEDVHVDMEDIDRDIYALRNSGKLKQAKGLLVGQFTDCVNRHEKSFGILDVLRDVLEGIDIPVMYNIQSGHGFPMMTIPMGVQCSIDTANRSIIFHMR